MYLAMPDLQNTVIEILRRHSAALHLTYCVAHSKRIRASLLDSDLRLESYPHESLAPLLE